VRLNDEAQVHESVDKAEKILNSLRGGVMHKKKGCSEFLGFELACGLGVLNKLDHTPQLNWKKFQLFLFPPQRFFSPH
jgi:hypothetical protein